MEHEERLGGFVYRWDGDCFPLGQDSLALGEFCSAGRAGRVLDLGCGAGLLLLLCAGRNPGAVLTGVERDPHAAALARDNLARSGLTGEILTGDWGELDLPRADLVVSNPPWYPAGARGGPARVEDGGPEGLWEAAGRALDHGGRFALVYDPARLAGLLAGLRERKLEPKRMRLCRHSPEKAPYAVLVEAVKGGRPGLEILPDRVERKV